MALALKQPNGWAWGILADHIWRLVGGEHQVNLQLANSEVFSAGQSDA